MKKRTNQFIDISIPVWPGVAHWPGVSDVEFQKVSDIAHGDVTNDTTIRLNVHTGTHLDAPSHFFACAETVDQLPIDRLIGSVLVVHLPRARAIDAKVLKSLRIPLSTRRILFKTRNSLLWENSPGTFDPRFVAMTADGAQWIANRDIKLVGVDYLSVQRFGDGPQTHQILLSSGIIILEGLQLGHVAPGQYDLICLPIRLKGLEGAPARAVLRRRA